ncbi:MAG: T9SS type A sorting domain-containing protein [Candidatus Latescibacteria bacterium]|nr:T9SS type A sorting domain-containing protein [Candidatus Latescibacterota bacterium]
MKLLRIFAMLLLAEVWSGSVYANDYMNEYPSGNSVNEIVFQGNYAWSATYGSLVRWDKRDGSYIQYTTNDGLISNNVMDLAFRDDGKLWIATTRGVNIFDGQSFEKLTTGNSGLMDDRVHCITLADDGVLWFGTAIGISTFDGESWVSYDVDDMVEDHRAGGYVSDIMFDKTGVVWAVVWKYDYGVGPNTRAYLTSFDGTTWTMHNGADGNLKALRINAIAVDNNNTIWAATSGDNIAGPLYTFNGEIWTDSGINAVHDIDVDENGTVYLARGDYRTPSKDDKYITTFDGTSYVDLPVADHVNLSVYAFSQIFVDEPGIFWFRINAGSATQILYSYDGESAKQRSTVGPLTYYITEMMVDSSNTKWIATTFGLSRYDDVTWENIVFDVKPEEVIPGMSSNAQISANYIRDMAIDQDGILWLTTLHGIRKYDNTGGVLYHDYNTNGINEMHSTFRNVAVDKNNVKWFAGGEYLYRYDGGAWSSIPIERYQNEIYSMEVDHNNVLWFGAEFPDGENVKGGVASFDGTTWTYYDIDNSPLRGDLALIAFAEDNTMWVATTEGYYSFDGTNWTSYEDIKRATYPWHQPNDILIDKDGIVWFMVSGCLHSFDGNVWDDHGKQRYDVPSQFVIDQNDVMWIVSGNGSGYITSFAKAAILTDVAEDEKTPEALSIIGNYPNPFNPSTTIEFMLPEYGTADLVIYNIMGQKVRDLVSGQLPPGTHYVVWNGRDNHGNTVSSGVYICRLKSGEKVMMKQMMLLK